ncbi:MAG: acylneuraminate cytidylyltransferase family protein [Desulfobacterales bacterium]|nr:acylneuraminate cytidylyltransferase family protein [Desulfobacterales bacterium]
MERFEIAMESICIIPAKGYSRRLPRKNMLSLGGVPMVVRSVRSALDAERFSLVAVSSDDNEILEVSEKAGAIGLLRDSKLCDDDIRAKDVVRHHLKAMDHNFEIVCMLMNTNPFRTDRHVREAFDLMIHSGSVSLVSVCEYTFNPGLAMRIENNRLRPYVGKELTWEREDKLPKGYHLNGAIFMSRYGEFMKERTFLTKDTEPYVMDAESSLDIDSLVDLQFAETYLNMAQ